MARIQEFEDLEVWKLARKLTVQVYALSRNGAFAKDYGFCNQIRRAVVSIVFNIAEGFERRSNSQFIQFLDIANGSAGEVRAQLYVALDLGHITQEQFQAAFNDITDRQIVCTVHDNIPANIFEPQILMTIGGIERRLLKLLRNDFPQPPSHPAAQPPNHLTT